MWARWDWGKDSRRKKSKGAGASYEEAFRCPSVESRVVNLPFWIILGLIWAIQKIHKSLTVWSWKKRSDSSSSSLFSGPFFISLIPEFWTCHISPLSIKTCYGYLVFWLIGGIFLLSLLIKYSLRTLCQSIQTLDLRVHLLIDHPNEIHERMKYKMVSPESMNGLSNQWSK